MNKTNLEEVNKNPQGWDSYCQDTMAKWEKLLNSETCKERDIHSFLEMHHSMIPGAFGISLISGHNPLYSSVFSKPILPGYKFKIPDFMWIAICSDEINPVLIEIEEPNKKWLTKKSTPRTEFTQAYDQLIKWQEWFQKSYNLQSFLELYQINNAETRSKTIVPYYVLIYGRRDELIGNEGKRSAFNNKKKMKK